VPDLCCIVHVLYIHIPSDLLACMCSTFCVCPYVHVCVFVAACYCPGEWYGTQGQWREVRGLIGRGRTPSITVGFWTLT